MEHFQNLKRYKTDQDCSATSVAEEEPNTDSSTPATASNSQQPFVSLNRLNKQAKPKQPVKDVEPNEETEGHTVSETNMSCSNQEPNVEETTTVLTTGDLDSVVDEPAVTTDSAQSVSNEGNTGEKGGKKNSKAAVTTRRRTVRATNRR